MSARMAQAFADANGPLLIPYLPPCWPRPDDTLALMRACESAGAGVIELGVPFTDPSADGPVIQRANDLALENGATLERVLKCATAYKDSGGTLPVVLMGYSNPFLQFGPAELARACADSGVDGVLAVDWPPSPGDGLGEELASCGVDRIVLAAPSTSGERLGEIAKHASGYIYYVSIQGTTGSPMDSDEVASAAQGIRSGTGLPVAVGFGVRTPSDCARLGKSFDGVIVGTQLVEVIGAAGDGARAATELLSAMSLAMRSAP